MVAIKVASEPNPPLHLFLGQDAYDLAKLKIKTVENEMGTWEEIAIETAFEAEQI